MNFCNAEVPAQDLQLKIRIGENMSNIAEVNDTTVEIEVLQSKQPVLVGFLGVLVRTMPRGCAGCRPDRREL